MGDDGMEEAREDEKKEVMERGAAMIQDNRILQLSVRTCLSVCACPSVILLCTLFLILSSHRPSYSLSNASEKKEVAIMGKREIEADVSLAV